MNQVRFRIKFWEGWELPAGCPCSTARSPVLSQSSYSSSPFQVKSQAPALWSYELSWWAIHLLEEKHSQSCVLWCRGLFLPLSRLRTSLRVCSIQLGFRSWKEVWAADKTTTLFKTTLLFLAEAMHWFCFKDFFLIKLVSGTINSLTKCDILRVTGAKLN